MEYHIDMARPVPDLARLEAAVLEEDPSAVVDLDQSGQVLRVSTSTGTRDLAWVLGAAGCPVGRRSITIVPSICCGGCSG